jgi:hypothetical protein
METAKTRSLRVVRARHSSFNGTARRQNCRLQDSTWLNLASLAQALGYIDM